MKKLIVLLSISFLIFCCKQKKSEVNTTIESETSSSYDESKFGRENFAVVWNWETKDAETVLENLPDISKELTKLWEDDIMENAYYDATPKKNSLKNMANIAFFIKAHSEEKAEKILDELIVVKKGFANYTLHPVGTLWLERNFEVIYQKGITKSYVTIWKTNSNQASDELKKDQSDSILKLWNEGQIENVYFDIKGTQEKNNKRDFVFFINSKTQEEAEKICKSLPFYKNKIATYRVEPVGVFWYGKNKDQ